MKTLLLCLLCAVVGWFARDYVRVSYASASRELSVALPAVSVAKAVPKPVQSAKAVPVKKKEVPAPLPVQAEPEEAPEPHVLGRAVANSGLWRVNPLPEQSPLGYCAGYGSCLHGTPGI